MRKIINKEETEVIEYDKDEISKEQIDKFFKSHGYSNDGLGRDFYFYGHDYIDKFEDDDDISFSQITFKLKHKRSGSLVRFGKLIKLNERTDKEAYTKHYCFRIKNYTSFQNGYKMKDWTIRLT